MPEKVFSVAQPEQSPGFLLWQVSMIWQRAIKQALLEHNISHVQFVLLAVLLWLRSTAQPAIQVTLVSMTKLDKMTVSQALKKLIALGYVKRSEHETDTRAKTVALTSAGVRLAKKLVPVVESVDENFFSALAPDEYKSLLSLLQKLIANSDK